MCLGRNAAVLSLHCAQISRVIMASLFAKWLRGKGRTRADYAQQNERPQLAEAIAAAAARS